jgi:hypothetical protein
MLIYNILLHKCMIYINTNYKHMSLVMPARPFSFTLNIH